MDTSTWIAIYLPLIILFLCILPYQSSTRRLIKRRKKKKNGVVVMTNELIKKYIGRNCMISTGSLGANTVGKILEVNDNWVEVETKKDVELINIEYVQSIRIVNR